MFIKVFVLTNLHEIRGDQALNCTFISIFVEKMIKIMTKTAFSYIFIRQNGLIRVTRGCLSLERD